MKILIRGAGDLATGIAIRLYESGHEIVMTERAVPLTVRRSVAFSRAVYEGQAVVEGITAVCVQRIDKVNSIVSEGKIAVIVDEKAAIKEEYKPQVIVDAILAKKNTGTRITDASLVIGVGPGFTAGEDCHCVVETKRGHDLGKVIRDGSAIPNTGIPGEVGGYGIERLIKSTAAGTIEPLVSIGDYVEEGQIVARTGGRPVYAKMSGMVRGMLQPEVYVTEGLKIGDIDARHEPRYCHTVSDKARAVGGGVLEAVTAYEHRKKNYAVVVLAAGSASRYGRNKLLDEIGGRRMFEYLFEELDALKNVRKIVVTGYEEIRMAALEKGFDTVWNAEPQKGIALSLRLGLLRCLDLEPDLSGVIFTVCDQPGLKRETFLQLLNLGKDCSGKIICPVSNGNNGSPVLWDQKYFRELLQLEGDTGGRQIMKAHRKDLILFETDAEQLKDIDYPCDKEEQDNVYGECKW